MVGTARANLAMDRLKQLESFVAIATRGSLTAAAKAEGVAPAIMGRRLDALEERIRAYGREKLAKELGIGLPTLADIAAELRRPGRDMRDELPKPLLRTDVMSMEDLKPGMELAGTVRNVIDFGAFVDIGVHQDGLVHVSQISNKFIRHPSEMLKVGDVVTVWVLSVDTGKKRISLTMKKPAQPNGAGAAHK